MSTRFKLSDFGLAIPLDAARRYLENHGWETLDEGGLLVCQSPPDETGQRILRALPLNESARDFPLRMEDLIASLCQLEERPAIEIVREMSFQIAHMDFQSPSDLIENLVQIVKESLPKNEAESLLLDLTPMLANLQLVLTEAIDVPKSSIQQAAIGATLVGRRVSGPIAPLIVWRISARVLREADLILPITPEQLAEFFQLARDDDPASPDRVWEWLNSRAAKADEVKKSRKQRRRR